MNFKTEKEKIYLKTQETYILRENSKYAIT